MAECPDFKAIHNLFTLFDDDDLESFCLVHLHKEVHNKFGHGMSKIKKVNLLIRYLIIAPLSHVRDLMQQAQEDHELLFDRCAPYFKPCEDLVLLDNEVPDDPYLLVAQLLEWKTLHNDTQEWLNALNIPMEYLRRSRVDRNPSTLDEAGFKWQSSCVPRLKETLHSWLDFQYVHTPALTNFLQQTADLDKITKKLMEARIEETWEFKQLNFQFEQLGGTSWTLLNIADKKILTLVKALQQRIGG